MKSTIEAKTLDISPHRLILASQSKPRRSLLTKLNIDFDCYSPNIDESPLAGEHPKAMTKRLSIGKAEAVAGRLNGTDAKPLIIGSDQVATLEEPSGEITVFGKPGTPEKAREQLTHQAGKLVTFYTALTLLDVTSQRSKSIVEPTKVYFRDLDADAIARYVELEQPLECAGSFQIEGYGITLIERLEGNDPNALIGLPLIQLVKLLGEFGVAVP